MAAQELYRLTQDFHSKQAREEYDNLLEQCRQAALVGQYHKRFKARLQHLVIYIFEAEGFKVHVNNYNPDVSNCCDDVCDNCRPEEETVVSWEHANPNYLNKTKS